MSDDQDGGEWVSVSSGTGSPGPTAVKQLCVCVCVYFKEVSYLGDKTNWWKKVFYYVFLKTYWSTLVVV